MADLDVSAEIDILADPADVAAVMFDPAREPEWVKGVTRVELLDAALAPGARVRHHASLLGRDFDCLTVVEAVHFPHVLSLKVDEGPFTGTLRFDVQRAGAGTRARVRGAGNLSGEVGVPAIFLSGPVRGALQSGLERLKQIVEGKA